MGLVLVRYTLVWRGIWIAMPIVSCMEVVPYVSYNISGVDCYGLWRNCMGNNIMVLSCGLLVYILRVVVDVVVALARPPHMALRPPQLLLDTILNRPNHHTG